VIFKLTLIADVQSFYTNLERRRYGTKAVHARGHGFSILGLGIELRQANNSNALFVEGHGFEIAHNVLTQKNLCFWGDQVCVRNIARCFLQIRSCILHMPGFLETIETKALVGNRESD
jgi:hypothetical protein